MSDLVKQIKEINHVSSPNQVQCAVGRAIIDNITNGPQQGRRYECEGGCNQTVVTGPALPLLGVEFAGITPAAAQGCSKMAEYRATLTR